jgi:hypothetical protein
LRLLVTSLALTLTTSACRLTPERFELELIESFVVHEPSRSSGPRTTTPERWLLVLHVRCDVDLELISERSGSVVRAEFEFDSTNESLSPPTDESWIVVPMSEARHWLGLPGSTATGPFDLALLDSFDALEQLEQFEPSIDGHPSTRLRLRERPWFALSDRALSNWIALDPTNARPVEVRRVESEESMSVEPAAESTSRFGPPHPTDAKVD